MARMRERALALRPVMEAMSKAADEERQLRNFAFTEERVGRGEGDARDEAILRARSVHAYDWDRSVRYASGWYAAHAGWEPEVRRPGCATPGSLAYEQGFSDGGGNRNDLFDTARRAFEAALPADDPPVPTAGRPLPSAWPRPTDEPLPPDGRGGSSFSARPKPDCSARVQRSKPMPRCFSRPCATIPDRTSSPSS
jgi:hypothetical protein